MYGCHGKLLVSCLRFPSSCALICVTLMRHSGLCFSRACSLKEKRKKRNPTRRFHPYFSSAPELADLLDWCPADNSGLQGIYPETLPWDLRVVGNGLGRGAKALREQAKQAKAGKLHLPDYRWLEIAREGH